MLNNIVTLKSELEVTRGHWNWYTIRKPGCSFPFAFHSNYGAILYRMRDIATYWSKMAKFLHPVCIYRPWNVCVNFVKMF